MQKGRAERYLMAIALAVAIGLLILAVVQLHPVEERLAVQGRQIRALGETTDRLLSQGPRPGGGPAAQSAAAPAEGVPAHVLHPEVPHLLVAKGLHWPAPRAVPGGVLRRGIHTE